MTDHAGKDFLEQATQSLQGGRFEQALEFVENALALDPNNAQGYILRGIAESNLGRSHDAEESFRRAAELEPTNAKAFYNLAVHYFGAGRKKEAMEAAEYAVEADPKHAGAKELVLRLEKELGVSSRLAQSMSAEQTRQTGPQPFSPPVASMPYRRGYESPLHSIVWIENLGKGWDATGWAIAAFATLCGVLFWSRVGTGMLSMVGNQDIAALSGGSSMGEFAFWGAIVLQLLALVWMMFEMVDRRGPWLWLLPFLLCCFCGGAGITMGIYLIAGRLGK